MNGVHPVLLSPKEHFWIGFTHKWSLGIFFVCVVCLVGVFLLMGSLLVFCWVVLFCFFNVWEPRVWPLYPALSSLCGPCSDITSVEAVPEFTAYLLRAAPAGIYIRTIFTSWWTVSSSSHPADSELSALIWKVWIVWSGWWEQWSQTHHSVYWNIGSNSYFNISVSIISYSGECSCTENDKTCSHLKR